jgi:hypothetical protein
MIGQEGNIQAWPTPELFVKRGAPIRNLSESAKSRILLSGFDSPALKLRTFVEHNPNANLALSGFGNPAQLTRASGDVTATRNSLALSGFSPGTPFIRNRTDQANSRLALSGFDSPTAHSRSASENTPKNSIALSGFKYPMTPERLSLLVRYRSSSMAGFANNDLVGAVGKEWLDLLGNTNHHGRNAVSATAPVYKTNVIGTVPGVLFTWKSDFTDEHYLDCTNGSDTNSVAPAGDYTLIAVVQISSVSASVGGCFYGNGYPGNSCSAIVGPTTLTLNDQLNTPVSLAFADITDVPVMVVFKRSGGNIQFRLNKTNITSGTTAVNAGHFHAMGATATPLTQARFGGYIFENMVANNAVSDSDLNALYDDYMKPLYTTLP